MEKRKCCIIAPCAILLLSLFGHVTHGFILLSHVGSNFGNKNNFTLLDIDDASFDLPNDDPITSLPDADMLDDSIRTYYRLDDEIVTLTHDTETPEHRPGDHPSNLHGSSSRHSNSDGRSDPSVKSSTYPIGGADADKAMPLDIPPTSHSWHDDAMSKSQKQQLSRKTTGNFPEIFERQEIIEVPKPISPTELSSLQDLQESRSPRVKRRARPSVIVRVPPSSRYPRAGIKTYVSSPRQSRIDAQVGVLVVADHSVYTQYMKTSGNSHRMAVARIRRYFGMVFAMMNERFGTIKDSHLSIKVTISGILIAERRTDSLWTENIVNWSTKPFHGRASVETGRALRGFSQWLEDREGLPEHDHAMMFTAYRLTDPYGMGLGGMAYLEAVCDTKTGNAVSIVGDKGDFQSVRVATHELAHSLGATHDGERGAEACKSSDAFIMSSMTTHNQHAPLSNAFYFSKCSINDMLKHLSKDRSSCVLDKPPVYYNYDLDRFPPGRTHSPDTQCQLIFGPRSKFCGDSNLATVMCGQLWCKDPNREKGCRTNSYLTALPGTKCGSNGFCSLGVCKPQQTKPDNRQSTVNYDVGNLRPTARIGGINRQSTTNVDVRGVTGGRDLTISGGTPASRIGTVHNDRRMSGGSLRDRSNGVTGNDVNNGNVLYRGRTINRNNVGRRGNDFNKDSVVDSSSRGLNRESVIDRTRGRIITRGSVSNTDRRGDRESVDRRGSVPNSNVYRGSGNNWLNTNNNRYNILTRDNTISRDVTKSRDNLYNRDSTINRDATLNRDNTYNRGSTTRGSDNIHRDNTRDRISIISRDGKSNWERTHNSHNTVNRGNSITRGSTYDRSNRDGSTNRSSTYRPNNRITKGTTPSIGDRLDRNRVVYKTVPINRINPVIGDNRIGITVRGDSRVNRNRIEYPHIRTTKESSRDRDNRLNRDRNSIRQDRINRDSNLARDNRYRNRDNSTSSVINRGSKDKNDLTRTSIRNVGGSNNRTNAIPKTHRYSRPNDRIRKQRGRRHRNRNRGRSGTRRSGRRKGKKNRGKKKNRCRKDKNKNYCQGLIDLNPEGCRRKAIRQYCCATCRRWRKSKRKMSQSQPR